MPIHEKIPTPNQPTKERKGEREKEGKREGGKEGREEGRKGGMLSLDPKEGRKEGGRDAPPDPSDAHTAAGAWPLRGAWPLKGAWLILTPPPVPVPRGAQPMGARPVS